MRTLAAPPTHSRPISLSKACFTWIMDLVEGSVLPETISLDKSGQAIAIIIVDIKQAAQSNISSRCHDIILVFITAVESACYFVGLAQS